MNDPVFDEHRLKSLRDTGLLDSASEESFDRLTRFATRMLNVPISLVTLVDADRQYFKSHAGLDASMAEHPQTPLSHSFCKHVVHDNVPLIIEDARSHPLVQDNPAIAELGVQAYLGVPFQSPDGSVLGSVCAVDMKPHLWSEDDLNVLKDLAHIVNAEIQLREELRYRAQSEERFKLAARELTHRIKNIFSLTSGIVTLSARGHPELDTFVGDVTARLNVLGRAQDYIQVGSLIGTMENARTIKGLLAVLLVPYPQKRLEVSGDDRAIGETAANGITFIIHELSTNALKYGAWSNDMGYVSINLGEKDGMTVMTWQERGGPVVAGEPERRGYGSKMMSQSAQSYFDGTIECQWDKEGLTAIITMKASLL